MSAHTPGPWFVDANGKVWRRDPRDLYENGGGVAGDHPVATVHRGWPRWEDGFPVEANARLIAAAPELLEFAKEWLSRQGSDDNYMTAKARATIAKAEGRS